MIKYSFLIPFWDINPTLVARMLDSIPDRDDVEILLLNNASYTLSFHIEDYPELRNKNVVITSIKERVTLGECRNIQIEEARGEWIIFADADDLFLRDELELLLDSDSNDNYDLIYWGTETIFTDGKIFRDSYGFEGTSILPLQNKSFLLQHRYEAWRKMIRRDLLQQHKEIRFEYTSFYEDVYFSIRLLLLNDKVGIFPPPIYQYIRSDNTLLCRRYSVNVLQRVFTTVFNVLDILKENQYSLIDQEISKGCLIKMKQASLIQFLKYLFVEWHRYGWKLFYRDLVGAGFETYETNFFIAMINYCRVKGGRIKCLILKLINAQ